MNPEEIRAEIERRKKIARDMKLREKVPVYRIRTVRIANALIVTVPADQTLLAAHILALRTSLKRRADEPEQISALERIIAEKEQQLTALKSNTSSK
jgi:hypothetical protein